jgi:chromosome segregation ATPase
LQPAAVNKNISQAPFDLSARMLESTDGLRLTVRLTVKNDSATTPAQAADRSVAFKSYVRAFAVMEYQKAVQGELNGAQVKERQMEKVLEKLLKEEERSNKHISEDNRNIQQATSDIAAGKTQIDNTTEQIETQRAMVTNTAADPKANKGAKKTMNDLEKDKKETIRKNVKRSKDIDSWNEDIRKEQRNIVTYQDKQKEQTANIKQQKEVVKSVQMKYDKIK